MAINQFDAAVLAFNLADKHLNGTDRGKMSDPYKDISDALLAANDPSHRANILAAELAKYKLTADAAVILQVDTNQPIPPPPKPRIPIHWANEAFNAPDKIKWLVKNLIMERSVSAVYADAGVGKTYILLHLAIHIALGLPWLGRPVTQRTVLFFDEENGRDRIIRRLLQILRGLGITSSTNIPFAFESISGLDFSNPSDVQEMHNVITTIKPGFIIWDALMDIMSGDENQTRDVKPVFQTVKRLSEEEDFAAAIIHHAGKDGKYRGSSSIKGAPDNLIEIEKIAGVLRFSSKKLRDLPDSEFSAVATWIPDDLDPEILTYRLAPTQSQAKPITCPPSQQYVLDYLKDNGASLVVDMVAAADVVSESSVKRAIADLRNKKIIMRVDDGKSGSKALYQLIADADPLDIAMFR